MIKNVLILSVKCSIIFWYYFNELNEKVTLELEGSQYIHISYNYREKILAKISQFYKHDCGPVNPSHVQLYSLWTFVKLKLSELIFNV